MGWRGGSELVLKRYRVMRGQGGHRSRGVKELRVGNKINLQSVYNSFM